MSFLFVDTFVMSEGALPDWGNFCDEQAQKLADCFKDELRQYRQKNPQYSDVPTAGFARLFTASFLTHFEETQTSNTRETHNAAAATTTLPPTRQKVWKSIFRKHRDTGDHESSEGKAMRGRSHTMKGTSSTMLPSHAMPPSSEQTSVVMSANMNMLQFNQSSDNFDSLSWSRCHVTLCLTHGMYQILIRCPPKTAQPKMSLFCFLITSVRPTSNVEVPDCSSSFVIRAKGPVEFVFDAKSKEAMMSWVEAISQYAGVKEDNSLSTANVTGRSMSYERALDQRSPDPASGQGRGQLLQFTPLSLSPQESANEELTVPATRTHRSSSVGNLEMSRPVRRVSDTSNSRNIEQSNTAQSPSQQRAATPPASLPTRSHDEEMTSSAVASPEVVAVMSTHHSTSSRSLNNSFIDGPPVADNASIASTNSSPTLSRKSHSPRNSPPRGNSPVHVRSQQDSELDVNADSWRQYPWFHGMISRIDAALLVTNHGDSGTGEYLIRESESRAGDLVLSFNYHGRAKHLRLSISSTGSCRVQHLEFRNILHMLEHFKTHPIPLESPGTTADIQLTSHLVVGTPVPNLPGARMEPIGSPSVPGSSRNTLSDTLQQSRTLSVRHNNNGHNNGNVYVLT